MRPAGRKPEWLKKRIPNFGEVQATASLLKALSLNTVCDGAKCPNRGECFSQKTATFMILGGFCTRQCQFCAVFKGEPEAVDPMEPANIGLAAQKLGLKHVVVTSVTRDDLPDGGAAQFASTVHEIRKQNPAATIELLIPDLKGNWEALGVILDSRPDVLNHNIETVPSLYSKVRPEAEYRRSLELLRRVKELHPGIFTKSGLMLGLGETEAEVYQVMDDLRAVDCDVLTIGQYLQPSGQHLAVEEYIHPDQFETYKNAADSKGFLHVSSAPFVRSSYHASMDWLTVSP